MGPKKRSKSTVRRSIRKSIDATWHRANPMPARPTLEQRLRWHLGHQKRCACREIPATLVALVKSKKLAQSLYGAVAPYSMSSMFQR